MKKIIRITTVPISLRVLLKGQLKFMSKFYEIVGVSSWGNGELKLVEDQEGIRVERVEMKREPSPLNDFISLINMIRLLIKEKPFIVHTHTPKAGLIGMLAARLCGIEHRIHTIAGLPLMETTGIKHKLLINIEKLTYACATQVWPNSYGLKRYIEKNISKSKKIKVLGNGSSNGIDTSYFNVENVDEVVKSDLKSKLGISKEELVFAFVGRITGDKGMTELITAFEGVVKSGVMAKLLLIGDYEPELDQVHPEILKKIKTLDYVIETGFQKDIRPYLAISYCLIHPSYREGFPNVVMQGLSMQIPAIVTDINGSNEIITDGENGLIVPPKNAEQLKNTIVKIATDTSLYLALKNKTRKSIVLRYERSVIWESYREEYQKLIK